MDASLMHPCQSSLKPAAAGLCCPSGNSTFILTVNMLPQELQVCMQVTACEKPSLTAVESHCLCACRYYDAVTTVTMFLGSSKDYTDVYLAAAHGMLAGDPDAIVGGPGVAYNINSDRCALCFWQVLPSLSPCAGCARMMSRMAAFCPRDFKGLTPAFWAFCWSDVWCTDVHLPRCASPLLAPGDFSVAQTAHFSLCPNMLTLEACIHDRGCHRFVAAACL